MGNLTSKLRRRKAQSSSSKSKEASPDFFLLAESQDKTQSNPSSHKVFFDQESREKQNDSGSSSPISRIRLSSLFGMSKSAPPPSQKSLDAMKHEGRYIQLSTIREYIRMNVCSSVSSRVATTISTVTSGFNLPSCPTVEESDVVSDFFLNAYKKQTKEQSLSFYEFDNYCKNFDIKMTLDCLPGQWTLNALTEHLGWSSDLITKLVKWMKRSSIICSNESIKESDDFILFEDLLQCIIFILYPSSNLYQSLMDSYRHMTNINYAIRKSSRSQYSNSVSFGLPRKNSLNSSYSFNQSTSMTNSSYIPSYSTDYPTKSLEQSGRLEFIYYLFASCKADLFENYTKKVQASQWSKSQTFLPDQIGIKQQKTTWTQYYNFMNEVQRDYYLTKDAFKCMIDWVLDLHLDFDSVRVKNEETTHIKKLIQYTLNQSIENLYRSATVSKVYEEKTEDELQEFIDKLSSLNKNPQKSENQGNFLVVLRFSAWKDWMSKNLPYVFDIVSSKLYAKFFEAPSPPEIIIYHINNSSSVPSSLQTIQSSNHREQRSSSITSSILDPSLLWLIYQSMPNKYVPKSPQLYDLPWDLLFSGTRDGYAMAQFRHQCFDYPDRTLLFIEGEINGSSLSPLVSPAQNESSTHRCRQIVIFGALVTTPWKTSQHYWGNEDCLLFILYPVLEVFPITKKPMSNLNRKSSFTTSLPATHGRSHQRSFPVTSIASYHDSTTYYKESETNPVYCQLETGIGFGGSFKTSFRLLIDAYFNRCVFHLHDSDETYTQSYLPIIPPFQYSRHSNDEAISLPDPLVIDISHIEVFGLGGPNALLSWGQNKEFEKKLIEQRQSINISLKRRELEGERHLLNLIGIQSFVN